MTVLCNLGKFIKSFQNIVQTDSLYETKIELKITGESIKGKWETINGLEEPFKGRIMINFKHVVQDKFISIQGV